MKDGAILPERCFLTNGELDLKEMNKKLFWSSPWYALFFLLHFLVYLVVYLIVRKQFKITFYGTRKVLRKRGLISFGGVMLLIVSIGLFTFTAVIAEQGESLLPLIYAGAGIVSLISSIVLIMRFSNALRANKHEDGWFRLVGAGQPFLDSLK